MHMNYQTLIAIVALLMTLSHHQANLLVTPDLPDVDMLEYWSPVLLPASDSSSSLLSMCNLTVVPSAIV